MRSLLLFALSVFGSGVLGAPPPEIKPLPFPPQPPPPKPALVPVPAPPIVRAPPLPPPPAPLPKQPAPLKLSTKVRAWNNPQVKKTKSGNPAQVYLGNLDDMRDLEITVATVTAQYESALVSRDSYREILDRQRRLLGTRGISREEYEQAVFDYEYTIATARAYASQIKFYDQRRKQKLYQKEVAAKHIEFKLEDFYQLYSDEWKAQCVADRDAVEAAEAQVNLNRFLYDMARRLQVSGAATYYELETHYRDLVSAQEDVAGKRAIEKLCTVGLPTLQELREMQDPI